MFLRTNIYFPLLCVCTSIIFPKFALFYIRLHDPLLKAFCKHVLKQAGQHILHKELPLCVISGFWFPEKQKHR